MMGIYVVVLSLYPIHRRHDDDGLKGEKTVRRALSCDHTLVVRAATTQKKGVSKNSSTATKTDRTQTDML